MEMWVWSVQKIWHEILRDITILEAIYWIAAAWLEIKEETIVKCFRKCGFSPEIISGLRTWQFVRPTSRTGRPATELIEELKPTQPDADTDEEEESSALPPSSTVCSVSETCQFIDHLKNVALAKNNQVMLDSIMKFQDEFFAHRVKYASVQKKISEFF